VRDPDDADPACVALDLQPLEVLAPQDEVVDLLDVDAAEPGELPRILLATLFEIFVATTASSRLPSSARASDSSASPYIGDVSSTRQPADVAASTIDRASARSPRNVPDVPRPTTGPRRRSSMPERYKGQSL
jgi:hypothetical protein